MLLHFWSDKSLLGRYSCESDTPLINEGSLEITFTVNSPYKKLVTCKLIQLALQIQGVPLHYLLTINILELSKNFLSRKKIILFNNLFKIVIIEIYKSWDFQNVVFYFYTFKLDWGTDVRMKYKLSKRSKSL